MRLKHISFAILICSIAVAGWIAWGLFGPTLSSKQKYLYIEQSTPSAQLLESIKEKEILQSNYWVKSLLEWWGVDTVRKGRYKISTGMTAFQLARNLRNGRQTFVKLPINKIRTIEELAGRIGNGIDSKVDSLQLLHYLLNQDSIKKFGVNPQTLLALTLPYTYELGWAENPTEIIERFYKRWNQFWTDDRIQKAREKKLNPIEVSILASIVEEETNNKEDRYLIASTYLNRLRIGMKLQADPTAKFASRDFKLNRIMYGHLKINSPYNTYLYPGLPPGPICTPSIQAIDAVLEAPETNYLFFVASWRFDGRSLFSLTYKDHQAYVKLFHEAQRKRLE